VNKEEPLKYAQYVFAIVLKHVLFQKLKYATIASVGNSGYSRWWTRWWHSMSHPIV